MEILRDIKFNDFGDIEISNKDIKLIHNKTEIIRQNAVDRIRSAKYDYALYNSFGADLASLIGRKTSNTLEDIAVSNITNSLTEDGFLDGNSIEVIALIKNQSMVIKVSIATLLSGFTSTQINITATINMISGIINVYWTI